MIRTFMVQHRLTLIVSFLQSKMSGRLHSMIISRIEAIQGEYDDARKCLDYPGYYSLYQRVRMSVLIFHIDFPGSGINTDCFELPAPSTVYDQ